MPNYNHQKNLLEEYKFLLDEGKFIDFCDKVSHSKASIFQPTEDMKNISLVDFNNLDNINEEELKLAVKWAAFLVKNDFKMSSLRKIFRMFERGNPNLEKVKFILAYEVGRKANFKEFGKFLESLINKAKDINNGDKKIKIFLEAIIAYHKLINFKK